MTEEKKKEIKCWKEVRHSIKQTDKTADGSRQGQRERKMAWDGTQHNKKNKARCNGKAMGNQGQRKD